MEGVFIRLLNMSIAASWLILAVLLLRAIFRKAPKSIRRILWALLGIRLVLPVSFESVLSLIPSPETVSPDILYAQSPGIHSGISAFNTYVNPVISESLAPAAGAVVNPAQVIASVASAVWIAGMAAMALYGVISYILLRSKVAAAVPLRDNLWQSEAVASPFVLGLFRPRIYLPFAMDEESLAFAVVHENAHIRRRDHWIKPMGFLLLTVYWFNPLIWLSYILLCRDIELACDERVVKEMDAEDKKAYSKALLTCSVSRRSVAACPVAFGGADVKERIKHVLNYKKPAFWILAAALLACAAAAVCFLTNPKTDPATFPGGNDNGLTDRTYSGGALLGESLMLSSIGPEGSYYMQIVLSGESLAVINDRGETVFQSSRSAVSQISRSRLMSLLETVNFRWKEGYGVPEAENITVYSYYTRDGSDTAAYSVYWFGGEAAWLALGETLRIYELEAAAPVTVYQSRKCIYMNPLSSCYPFGDSGYRYLMGEDCFTIVNKETGDKTESFSDIDWNWQPVKEDEWKELFPFGLAAPDISGYTRPMILELSDRYCLMDMDGALWLGQLSGGAVGMWSVFVLTPGDEGEVIWNYMPLLSSRYPAFPFRFELPYTRIEAASSAGSLIGFDDHNGTGYPQGRTLTVPSGSALYWSPQERDEYGDDYALSAEITFAVYEEDEVLYTGVLSITGTAQAGGFADYSAVLTGCDGLKMLQASHSEGAVLSLEE